ncbi:PHD finger protein 20 isoform X5 [Cephus cinctus]|uniref:PHD finger protein 20 isoform X5 n=1 Tax=Cephus cinctus TaxID=211228 RepID=A0AAJ7RQP5_CEPCN|nr:PHD finger protein 20 isoform X5 [Cephus cinctus]
MKQRFARSRGPCYEMPPTGSRGMARKCCVPNCQIDVRTVRGRGIPFHKFPKDTILRSKWIASGGFEQNFKPTPGQFVCHRHFKKADYETAKGQKFVLRKGAVPSVFDDYDNHPDPMTMPVKSSSYAQEDLDLINSEISNLDHIDSTTLMDAYTPKSDSCSEAYNSRPASAADTFNLFESSEVNDGEQKVEKAELPLKDIKDNVVATESKFNPATRQLGVTELEDKAESAGIDLKIIKEEPEQVATTEDKKSVENGDSKVKVMSRGGLKFFPGAKLEAKDFNEKWYSARVVETDWVEREVLIHFDKWSSRFDEWIPMDSSRLRVLQIQPSEPTWTLPSPETKMREFVVGEKILATWADGRKYPARVNAVLGNEVISDRYDVLFDDGYTKIVRSSKMTKIATTSEKKSVEGDYIGSKQERRDKKRKHTVMELFHTHSKKRQKVEVERPIKKEESVLSEDDGKLDLGDSVLGTSYDSGSEVLRGFENTKPKMKTFTKKKRKEFMRNETDNEEDVGPEWIDGEPQGLESYIVDGNDGPRRSIIVPDKRLPPGWQKHFTQRRTGSSAGKWDVLFIHKTSGKKFRSRNDIRAFMEQQGQFDFDPEKFDFCIHRKKTSKFNVMRLKPETPPDVPRKIKTLLPKAKTSTPENTSFLSLTSVTLPSATPLTPVDSGGTVYCGLRVEMEDSAYKCPKEGCNKNFRKENLLQMHIKHYHPEYSKFLGSTPNVADLAYARTIGESIEDIIPKKPNNFLEKINKFEKKKAGHEKPLTPVVECETPRPDKPTTVVKEETKLEISSPTSTQSIDMDEDSKKRESNCAMSPGTLFDMKVREEKAQVGIKTLLPVRPASTAEPLKLDRSKSLDESTHSDKGKVQKKRQLSEYSTEFPGKSKKKQGMQELMDDYGDLDDSALDVEEPATPMYRFSRRKSDPKSDENSQSSQLNDTRHEKGDTPKGDAAKRDNINDVEEGEGVMMMINGEMVKVEQLRREEIINCTCGYMEEDGLMIQCDLCLCWQHGHCNGIEREKDVPEKYVCYICRHPYRQRPSLKYFHDQDWIKEGILPSLPNRSKNQAAINQRTAMLKRSYDLVGALLQIQQVLHSLRVKINVAQKKDHPKLYLWAKNWEKSEIPKPDTDPVPVMEIIKTPLDSMDTASETSHSLEPKVEFKETVKEDPDKKSIASDTELMKILEEDSTHSDESKVIKKEDTQTDGHILLDALTRTSSPEKKTSENLTENPDTPSVDLPSTSQSPMAVSTPGTENLTQETSSLAQPETVPPMQPFIPEPEAPIDPAECRLRLLEHIEHFQNHIDSRLTTIEAQVCALEAMDPDDPTSSVDVLPRTKQTVQMLLRDLNTVRKLAALC